MRPGGAQQPVVGIVRLATLGEVRNRRIVCAADDAVRAQPPGRQSATENIDFENLAGSLGICYSTFRHSFKQQTGVSPAQFQNSIRINRAQDLLSSTDLSVSEIAPPISNRL